MSSLQAGLRRWHVPYNKVFVQTGMFVWNHNSKKNCPYCSKVHNLGGLIISQSILFSLRFGFNSVHFELHHENTSWIIFQHNLPLVVRYYSLFHDCVQSTAIFVYLKLCCPAVVKQHRCILSKYMHTVAVLIRHKNHLSSGWNKWIAANDSSVILHNKPLNWNRQDLMFCSGKMGGKCS